MAAASPALAAVWERLGTPLNGLRTTIAGCVNTVREGVGDRLCDLPLASG
jgi:hypothetical protein